MSTCRKRVEEEMDETKTNESGMNRITLSSNCTNQKKEKVRRVCNGATKHNGSSLNDGLLTGGDMLQNSFRILFRFKDCQIALTAVIEILFLLARMPSHECQVRRFLRRSNPKTNGALTVTPDMFSVPKMFLRVPMMLYFKLVWTTETVTL